MRMLFRREHKLALNVLCQLVLRAATLFFSKTLAVFTYMRVQASAAATLLLCLRFTADTNVNY